jgi:uncharacterized membrane protein YqhA
MLKKILEKSRFIVIIAVIGCLITTLTLLGFGIYEIGETLLKIPKGLTNSKETVLKFIEVVDTFLLATVFLIISIGLYELFVDNTLELPEWLRVNSLDDLKGKLVGVVIIVLGVIFLGNTAKWSAGSDILYLGGGVAAVIFALTYFLRQKK